LLGRGFSPPRDLDFAGVGLIPFSLEASGVWGPAARRFFAKCLYLADDDRDIDVYPTYHLSCLVFGSWFFILVGFIVFIVGTSAFIY
jgi:hypothetical protein